MATKNPIDLGQLTDTYEILGNIPGAPDVQVALASRRTDGKPVLITVHGEPQGDEGNALSHLASDAQILREAAPGALVPVLESRWLATGALAIVTERISWPSLAERLVRRDEDFSFPRIAFILRELNSALEWARERKVVHRALDLDHVYVEDGSDRVRARFVPRALDADGIPDEHDDSRMIATLARAMMTRSVADPERDELPLAEVRPGLSSRVVQQTEALLGRAESIEPVDVRSYLSALAMADELRRGEDECVRVTAEMSEEQRLMREALAAERKAHEEDLAEQARRFEQERDEILRTMAKEREEAARAAAKEREEGEKLLRQERARLEKEIEKQRVLLAKERAKLERERQAFEREREKGRARIAAQLAAIQTEKESVAGVAEPVEDEIVAPVEDEIVEPADDEILEPEIEEVAAPVTARFTDEAPEPSETSRPDDVRHAGPLGAWPRTTPRRVARRLLAVGAGVLLLLITVVALAMARRRGSDAPEMSRATPTADVRVVDSLAGVTVAPPPIDSAAMTVPSSPAASAPRTGVRRPSGGLASPAVSQPAEPPPVARAPDTTTRVDTVASPSVAPAIGPLPFTRPDSAARVDSMIQRSLNLRRDTNVRRDTAVRRDSVVTPRRDTLLPPPDTILTAPRP